MTAPYTFRKERLPRFAYTKRGYNEWMEELIAMIPVVSPTWTDHNPSDPGVQLLSLGAYLCDQQALYLDVQANEAYLETCAYRDNAFAHAEGLGYFPHGRVPASGTLTITLDQPATTGVEILKYWQATTSSGLSRFVVAAAEDAYIPAGSSAVTFAIIQGEKRSATATGTGAANQRAILPEGACEVGAAVNNEDWTRVDTFVGQLPSAKVYRVKLLWDNTTAVLFGDGSEGMCPPADQRIDLTYLYTRGSEGNSVAAGLVTHPVDALMDGATDVSRQCSIANNEQMSNGDDEETLEHIRRMAQRAMHALYRTIAGNDYVTMAESFEGVARAYCIDHNNYDTVERLPVVTVSSDAGSTWAIETSRAQNRLSTGRIEDVYDFTIAGAQLKVKVSRDARTRLTFVDEDRYCYLTLYVVPVGGGLMTDTLRSGLSTLLEKRRQAGIEVVLADAEYVTVDVTVRIYKRRGYTDQEVLAAVTEAIQDYFSYDEATGSIDWGQDITVAELAAVLNRVAGVSYVTLVAPSEDITIESVQIPALGAMSITIAGVS